MSLKGFNYFGIAVAVIVVVFVGGLSMYGYNAWVAPLLDSSGDSGIPSGGGGSSSSIYSGNIRWVWGDTNYVSGGAHTIANAVVYYSNSEPSDTGAMTVVTIAGHTIPLPSDNKGWAYLALHNGDDEFVITPWMESAFLQENSRIKDVSYRDLNGDDKDEMILKVWLGDIEKSTSTDPVVSITCPWVDEDTSITDDSPADQTGLGVVAGTSFSITWVLSGLTAGDGEVISKIWVVTNGTSAGDDIRLESLGIAGGIGQWTVKGDKTYWTNPTSTVEGAAYWGYYLNQEDYLDPLHGILVYRPTSSVDRCTVTLTGKLYLEAENTVSVTLTMETLGGDGANTQVSDVVLLNGS